MAGIRVRSTHAARTCHARSPAPAGAGRPPARHGGRSRGRVLPVNALGGISGAPAASSADPTALVLVLPPRPRRNTTMCMLGGPGQAPVRREYSPNRPFRVKPDQDREMIPADAADVTESVVVALDVDRLGAWVPRQSGTTRRHRRKTGLRAYFGPRTSQQACWTCEQSSPGWAGAAEGHRHGTARERSPGSVRFKGFGLDQPVVAGEDEPAQVRRVVSVVELPCRARVDVPEDQPEGAAIEPRTSIIRLVGAVLAQQNDEGPTAAATRTRSPHQEPPGPDHTETTKDETTPARSTLN